MEPTMLRELGSSYIRLKDNLISLHEDLCEIDKDQFSDLCKRARTAKSEGDTKFAVDCLKRAINLYKQDFLVEDIYNDAFCFEREKLRQQYTECLFELADLYEGKGSLRKSADLYKK